LNSSYRKNGARSYNSEEPIVQGPKQELSDYGRVKERRDIPPFYTTETDREQL